MWQQPRTDGQSTDAVFLGMTATWIDPDTFVRSNAALALRRLKGRHTHDRLAAAMARIHEEYGLTVPKLTKTTTDSAANFQKAFKVFASAPVNEGVYKSPFFTLPWPRHGTDATPSIAATASRCGAL